MKIKVFVLGNPIVKDDSLPLSLLPALRKKLPEINFITFDPSEELVIENYEKIIIVDTVINSPKVIQFNNLNQWTVSPRVTLHDYDLPLSLGIMKKFGKLKELKIIGVPSSGNKKEILNQIIALLKAI